MIGPGAHGAVASSYTKQPPPIPYGTIVEDFLCANGEGRRNYNGTGASGNFVDYLGVNWSGGQYPGYRLQFQLAAFMEASPPGHHYIGLQIGATQVIDYALQEPPGGGGQRLATPFLDVASSYTGALYIMDGTDFADNAHFKFIDVYYRYIRV